MMNTSRRHRMHRDDAHPAVELSTNPLLRGVLRNQVANPHETEIQDRLYEDALVEQTICDLQKRTINIHKEIAITRALLLMLLVQVPAGLVSFLVSPTAEWEMIAASFFSLLALKGLASKYPHTLVVCAGAIVANILIGCLVGESIHFGWTVLTDHLQLNLLTGTVIGLAFIICFYATFIGDILYIKRTHKMQAEVKKEGDRILIVMTMLPLGKTDRWWITWGLSSSSVWSPLHGVYILARFVDWLTASSILPTLSTAISIIRRW